LEKKKIALQRSMDEIRQKHVKKLMDLKQKLRSYKTETENEAGDAQSKRSRRISVVLRSNFESVKDEHLQETLRDMELELQNQHTEYSGEVIDLDAAAENNEDGIKHEIKSMPSPTSQTAYHRHPLPPTKNTVSMSTPSSAAMHIGMSRHNKLLRQQQKLSPRRTRALVFPLLCSQNLIVHMYAC
jgi:hypothetical protein